MDKNNRFSALLDSLQEEELILSHQSALQEARLSLSLAAETKKQAKPKSKIPASPKVTFTDKKEGPLYQESNLDHGTCSPDHTPSKDLFHSGKDGPKQTGNMARVITGERFTEDSAPPQEKASTLQDNSLEEG
jgi:hypothetical protein